MTAGREAEGAGMDHASARLPSRAAKLLSALFYGTCSFLLVLVNKALLTTYRFPSPVVLGIGQMTVTIMILYVSKLSKLIHFPDFDKKIPIKLFPLPLLYIGNHISGLSSTSKLRLWTRRLSGHGSQAHPLHGMWDLPGPGHEPASPASADGLSTTAPPGKPAS
uniref:Solute carrier family 35 member D2 n=1 Tax=Phocoena sinus TaxID=42100 RepID=A0A8C9B1F9_PHOSS